MKILNKTWKEALQLWRKKKASLKPPDKLIKEMARCLLPDIISYCESEEGRAAFEEWKAKQEAEKGKSKAS